MTDLQTTNYPWRLVIYHGPRSGTHSFSDKSSLIERLRELLSISPPREIAIEESETCCLALGVGEGYGVLSFNEAYPNTLTAKSAQPFQLTDRTHFVVDDGNGIGSEYPHSRVLEAKDVIAIVDYILEHHTYPTFVKWRPGA